MKNYQIFNQKINFYIDFSGKRLHRVHWSRRSPSEATGEKDATNDVICIVTHREFRSQSGAEEYRRLRKLSTVE